MPSRAEIVTFDDSPPPRGAEAWVAGASRAIGIELTGPGREQDDVPALEKSGFRLTIREPWWYNARKRQVIREIYHRAFVATGLLEN